MRFILTKSDGSNPFLGANFEAAVPREDVVAEFDQENKDWEVGVKHHFTSGPFVGLSLRDFDYSDPFFPQTDYEGTIVTFNAGFTF